MRRTTSVAWSFSTGRICMALFSFSIVVFARWRVASARENAQILAVAHQCKAPPQYRVVAGLAAVAGDRLHLSLPVYRDADVESRWISAHKGRAELRVQRRRDIRRDCPGI